jgi:mono/diheme cytochrome c family protein
MIRKLLPLTLAIAAVATLRLGAGGWAVVTVDALPESFVAAAPARLLFTVRQHGQTLIDGLQPTVTALADRDRITANVLPAGQSGRYVATFTFPRPADWVITIDSRFGAGSRLTLLPIPVVTDGSHAANPETAAARGLRLFVAKGCVTCHQNTLGGNTSLGVAAALVPGKHPDGLLASILLKPEAVLAGRSQQVGAMPNLALKGDEVTALVAYLNQVGTPIGSR